MNPAERPGAGNFHGKAYDAESDRVILFGGADLHDRPFGDTWAYDFESDNWARMSPALSPPARYYHGMTYDAANDRVLVFGGTDVGRPQRLATRGPTTATRTPGPRSMRPVGEALSLSPPRSEHSAQGETLDMQDVSGSSPVAPTKPLVG
jgi:hypothetical protein